MSDGAESCVTNKFSLLEAARKIEDAGHGYVKLQEKFWRASQGMEEPEEEKGSISDDEQIDEKAEEDYAKKRKKKTKEEIQKEALLMEDLYAQLGLEELGHEASMAQVGKAYKKAALLHHPDKLGENFTENDKKIWLKI